MKPGKLLGSELSFGEELRRVSGSPRLHAGGGVCSPHDPCSLTEERKPASNSTCIALPDGGGDIATYGYDGLTRRIYNSIWNIDYFYNNQWRPVEERRYGDSAPYCQYVWGTRYRDDLILRQRDTSYPSTLDETLWVTHDYYSPTGVMVKESGPVAAYVRERYGYSAFGIRRIMNMEYETIETSDFDWNFAFQGQFLDQESGFFNYGYRYYVPKLGRWLSRDPIGERGGVNLYEMARNNPINSVDYLGLDPVDKGMNAGYCNCDKDAISDGEYYLRQQAEEIMTGIAYGKIVPDPINGLQSCKINHEYLRNNLEVPGCWECRIECGTSTWKTRIQADGYVDHCVVMCRAHGADGFIEKEIILDITGGMKTPEEFRGIWTEPHDDTETQWESGGKQPTITR